MTARICVRRRICGKPWPTAEMGNVEKAMIHAGNRNTPFISEPVIGMVFDSKAEAYQFYNLYSWEVGFGIRYGSNQGGYRTMQEL
ncbi:hypothetical protein BS78_02G119200, partial [Paspalum vaginatum]